MGKNFLEQKNRFESFCLPHPLAIVIPPFLLYGLYYPELRIFPFCAHFKT